MDEVSFIKVCVYDITLLVMEFKCMWWSCC